jgi:uncharacterized protein YciI
MKRALPLVLTAALCLFAQVPAARYFVVFLRPDPARRELPKAEGERLQAAHMANIQKMGRDGFLMSAGPFDDTPVTISGIFVFKMSSLEAARALAAKDPTVLAQRNIVDVHTWLGPPGIGVEYFRLHKLDPGTPENMQSHPLCLLYHGAAWEEKRSMRDQLMAAHERYVDRLRGMVKLGAAGAMEAPDDLLGMVVFKPLPLEDARRLLHEDPAVQAGVLRTDFHAWWSSDHVLPW